MTGLHRMNETADFPAHIRQQIVDLQASKIREVSRDGLGRDGLLPLWFGEPDQPTPKFICDAADEALAAGHTFYTANRGIPPLREILSEYMTNLYGVPVNQDRITLTVGAMNAIMLIMQAIVGPGDNVIVVEPLWPNCRETVAVMGGEPRLVQLEEIDGRWQLDLDRLFDSCDGKTRGIFINSPGNPTGWVMPADQQRQVLDFCRRKNIWIISDEVYARIIYDRPYAPSFVEIADPDDPLIVTNSFSKSWSMTGWRLGWLTTPPALGDVLDKLMEYNVSHPTTFVQHAGIVAVRDGEDFVKATVERYRLGRDLVYQRLSAMPRVRLPYPEAAFYAFFAVDGMADSLAYATEILDKANVGLAPGSAFGSAGEGHLRLCFAATTETLSAAMDRLEPYLS